MKKSSLKWIALGAVATSLVAFSAGMTYALNKLKKIHAEDEESEAENASDEEAEESEI